MFSKTYEYEKLKRKTTAFVIPLLTKFMKVRSYMARGRFLRILLPTHPPLEGRGTRGIYQGGCVRDGAVKWDAQCSVFTKH